jgi:hypothetical protein
MLVQRLAGGVFLLRDTQCASIFNSALARLIRSIKTGALRRERTRRLAGIHYGTIPEIRTFRGQK